MPWLLWLGCIQLSQSERRQVKTHTDWQFLQQSIFVHRNVFLKGQVLPGADSKRPKTRFILLPHWPCCWPETSTDAGRQLGFVSAEQRVAAADGVQNLHGLQHAALCVSYLLFPTNINRVVSWIIEYNSILSVLTDFIDTHGCCGNSNAW